MAGEDARVPLRAGEENHRLVLIGSTDAEHLPCTRHLSRNWAEAVTTTESCPLRAHSLKQNMQSNTWDVRWRGCWGD